MASELNLGDELYEGVSAALRIAGDAAAGMLRGALRLDLTVVLSALSAAGLLPEERLVPRESQVRWRLLDSVSFADDSGLMQHIIEGLDLSPEETDFERAADTDDLMERFARLVEIIGIYNVVPPLLNEQLAFALDRNELWVLMEPDKAATLRPLAQALKDQLRPDNNNRLRTLLDYILDPRTDVEVAEGDWDAARKAAEALLFPERERPSDEPDMESP